MDLRKNIAVELGARLQRKCCNATASITELHLEPGTECIQFQTQATDQFPVGGARLYDGSGLSFDLRFYFCLHFHMPLCAEKDALGTRFGTRKYNAGRHRIPVVIIVIIGILGSVGGSYLPHQKSHHHCQCDERA